MEPNLLSLPGGRKVVFAPFGQTVDFDLPRPFVALLPAASAADSTLAEAIIGPLIELGCIEVCCVGPNAELMHDRLDIVVETAGRLEIITTWFGDEHRASEYMLFAAGGGTASILAMVLDQPRIVDRLKKAALETLGAKRRATGSET